MENLSLASPNCIEFMFHLGNFDPNFDPTYREQLWWINFFQKNSSKRLSYNVLHCWKCFQSLANVIQIVFLASKTGLVIDKGLRAFPLLTCPRHGGGSGWWHMYIAGGPNLLQAPYVAKSMGRSLLHVWPTLITSTLWINRSTTKDLVYICGPT